LLQDQEKETEVEPKKNKDQKILCVTCQQFLNHL